MITESEMTGAKALELRKNEGMTQAEFWASVGVAQSVGCRYEKDAGKLPRPVRMLLVARYVCGLEIDTDSLDGLRALSDAATVMDHPAVAKQIVGSIKRDVAKAIKGLETASKALDAITR